MTQTLPRLLLLLVLITSQWVYAEHNADSLHDHAIDCAVCMAESHDKASVTNSGFISHSPQQFLPVCLGQSKYAVAQVCIHGIRAPPVHQ